VLEVVRSTRGFEMTRPSVLNFEEVVAGPIALPANASLFPAP